MPPATLRERQNVVSNEEDEQQDGDDSRPLVREESHSLENLNEGAALCREKFNREAQYELSTYETDGRQIFRDILNYGRYKGGGNEPDRLRRMSCSNLLAEYASNMLDANKSAYESMMRGLNLDQKVDYKALEEICDELFRDDEVTWGRMITLCAYCMEVGRFCRVKNIDHVGLYVVEALWHYNRTRIVNWVSQEPYGWETVEQISPPPNNNTRRTLVAKTLLVVGIGLATAGSLVRYFR